MANRVMGEWRISARDRTGARIGVVDLYDKFEATRRHLDVGTWVLDMSLDDELVPELLLPGAGIVVELDDVARFSGPVRPASISIDGAARTVSLGGLDDLAALSTGIAHQQPADLGTATSAYDVRTGPAETVLKQLVNLNAGPGALAIRRVPGLTIATDLGRGFTVTSRARMDPLLVHCVSLATVAGLGLRCVDLVFDVVVPTDRSGLVEFSDDRDSLGAISFAREPPVATYVWVGGGGEGTARTFVVAQNADAVAQGWWRHEVFVDRRDTTDPTELAQAGAVALIGEGASGTDRNGVEITPLDAPGCQWPTDYDVGDLVAWVDPWGTRWVRLVQAVTLTLTPQLATATPVLGTIVPDMPTQFARLQSLARRTARLETR